MTVLIRYLLWIPAGILIGIASILFITAFMLTGSRMDQTFSEWLDKIVLMVKIKE